MNYPLEIVHKCLIRNNRHIHTLESRIHFISFFLRRFVHVKKKSRKIHRKSIENSYKIDISQLKFTHLPQWLKFSTNFVTYSFCFGVWMANDWIWEYIRHLKRKFPKTKEKRIRKSRLDFSLFLILFFFTILLTL